MEFKIIKQDGQTFIPFIVTLQINNMEDYDKLIRIFQETEGCFSLRCGFGDVASGDKKFVDGKI